MSAPEPPDHIPSAINPAEKIGPKNVSAPLPPRPAVATVRTPADDANFETDFADLAARFAAKSGGGLSPELSADLALEIVLNEIVEQACLATGGTGAAIVLRRGNDMICRATSGPLSPDLGSRLDVSGGLSGECVKTLRTVRCNDAQTDKRADIEASKRLGVRSVMVMPLLRGTELVGAFELFSSRVAAFGDRDERTLEALAARTLKNLTRAAQTLPPAKAAAQMELAASKPDATASRAETKPVAAKTKTSTETQNKNFTKPLAVEPMVTESMAAEAKDPSIDRLRSLAAIIAAGREAASSEAESTDAQREETLSNDGGGPDDPWWKRDFATLALTAAVLICTLLLGVVISKHMQIRQRSARVHAAPTVAAAKATQSNAAPNATPNTSLTPAGSPGTDPAAGTTPVDPSAAGSRTNGITIHPAVRGETSSVPPGGLRILDNGKEVFRVNPPGIATDKVEKGISVQQAAAIAPEQIVQLSPEAAEGGLTRRVEPQYPERARAQKIQGAVVLDVHIGSNGSVLDMHVVSGDPLLAQASTDAVKQWRFKPETQNGQPAQVQTRVTLNFRLPQ
jgi:TonB family protein